MKSSVHRINSSKVFKSMICVMFSLYLMVSSASVLPIFAMETAIDDNIYQEADQLDESIDTYEDIIQEVLTQEKQRLDEEIEVGNNGITPQASRSNNVPLSANGHRL